MQVHFNSQYIKHNSSKTPRWDLWGVLRFDQPMSSITARYLAERLAADQTE